MLNEARMSRPRLRPQIKGKTNKLNNMQRSRNGIMVGFAINVVTEISSNTGNCWNCQLSIITG